MRKFHHIPKQKQIDKGAKIDVVAVCKESKQQQNCVCQYIERSEMNRDQLIQAAHQRLKGIDAKCRRLKKADADAARKDAENGH